MRTEIATPLRRLRSRALTRLRPSAPPARFGPALAAAALEGALGPDLEDNVDRVRFPEGTDPPPSADAAAGMLAGFVGDADLEWFYARLADDTSRELMVRLFAFRLLGAAKVRIPFSGNRSWAEVTEQVRSVREAENVVDLQFLGWHGDRYDFTPLGHPIVLDVHEVTAAGLALEQYRSPQHPNVGVRPGDLVLDGGGAWGDTALYFAHGAGPQGRVRTFEFEPANLKRLRANMALNPHLAPRVDIDERALWDKSDETLSIVPWGPATRVAEDGTVKIPSVAIDDLELKHVDVIKLDIEGAELAALRGARATLLRDRPRLAISLYHRPEDWTTIPRFLDDLGVGYQFSLGHFTIHAEETVLFAWVS
jgi:FkbM family methyltransferase